MARSAGTEEARTFPKLPGLRATVRLDEDARHEGRLLALVILDLARDAGVRTVFVSKGTAGFGRDRTIHTDRLEVLAVHLPITVECIDERERVERLVERLGPLLSGGLLEVQPTTLVAPG